MASDDDRLGFGSWAMLFLALLVTLFFGFVFASQLRGLAGAFGVGGLIFLSAGMVGALLGFIFAVPRVIAKDGADTGGDGTAARLLSTNTNLERISDWLTTMLVGVGLSQVTNLNRVFLQFSSFLASKATVYDVGGHPSAGVLPAVGPFILILGAGCGFLFMYLLTRLVLVDFFTASEQTLRGVAVAAIRVAVSQGPPPTTAGAPGPDGTSPEPAGPSAAVAASLFRASQATTLSNDDALEIMFELLYEPGGYQRVIQFSAELSQTHIVRRAEYWFYLAAAFGQQMQHTAEGSEERASARKSAMDAAAHAVRIDRSFRGRLWVISNPNSTDNDLSLLRNDQDFRRLVGQK